MIILLIIGIVLTGLAIATLARVTVWPRQGVRSAEVPGRVEAYGFTRKEREVDTSGGVRGKLDEVATKLGAAVGGRSEGRSDRVIRKDLVAAGLYHVTPGRFLVVEKWESPTAQRAHFDSADMVEMAEACRLDEGNPGHPYKGQSPDEAFIGLTSSPPPNCSGSGSSLFPGKAHGNIVVRNAA